MKLDDLENNESLGKIIFESVPRKARPGWGTTLLQSFEKYLENVPEQIEKLYELTEDHKQWKQTKHQFSRIRKFLLSNPNFKPESYLILGELVAKITFNESGFAPRFNSKSGWAIALSAKRTADYFNDNELKNEILRILTVNLTPDEK